MCGPTCQQRISLLVNNENFVVIVHVVFLGSWLTFFVWMIAAQWRIEHWTILDELFDVQIDCVQFDEPILSRYVQIAFVIGHVV
jgi:hypothetical protein